MIPSEIINDALQKEVDKVIIVMDIIPKNPTVIIIRDKDGGTHASFSGTPDKFKTEFESQGRDITYVFIPTTDDKYEAIDKDGTKTIVSLEEEAII